MARPLIPFVQNGYYASRNWIPLVKGNGFTTSGGGEQEEVWETASGSIVTFDAIAAPLRQLSVAVEPVQNLNGYDNPWPAGGGKNKLQVTATTQTINGVTFTVNSDGSVNVNGTATANAILILNSYDFDGTSVILNGCPSGGSVSTFKLDAFGSSGLSEDIGSGVTISTSGTRNIRIVVFSGVTVSNKLFKPMICLASVTDATFSPYSNICPISGFDSVTVNRTGKNLLGLTGRRIVTTGEYANTNPRDFSEPSVYIGMTMNNYFLPRNVTSYSIAEDGKSVSVNSRFTGYGIGFNVYVKPGEKYYFSYKDKEIAPKTIGFGFYDKGGYLLSFLTVNTAANWAITIPENCYNMTVVFRPTQGETYTYEEPQLELGSTATAYEPYNGNTYTIQLGETVYGGTLDVVTGVVEVTHIKQAITSVTPWGATANGYAVYVGVSGATHIVTEDQRQSLVSNIFTWDSTNGYAKMGVFTYGGSSGAPQTITFILPPTVTSKAEADAWFAENPTECTFALATPFELTLTPEQISTLQGTNNVWSDAGDVTVEYRAQ